MAVDIMKDIPVDRKDEIADNFRVDGAEVTVVHQHDGRYTIIAVYPDTPAANTGSS